MLSAVGGQVRMLSTLQALAARRHIYRQSLIGHRSSALVLLFDHLTTVCLHMPALLLSVAAAATPPPNSGMQAVVASGATAAAAAAAADDDSSCMYHLLFAQSNSSHNLIAVLQICFPTTI